MFLFVNPESNLTNFLDDYVNELLNMSMKIYMAALIMLDYSACRIISKTSSNQSDKTDKRTCTNLFNLVSLISECYHM